MLTHPTLEHLRALKLDGMARALEEQRILPACHDLAFEDRFGMLVDRERHWRDDRRLERLLKAARLKHADACIEDVDYNAGRGLAEAPSSPASPAATGSARDRASCSPVPTGAGKTWLACALGQHACRQGFPALYLRVPRLTEMLRIAHADGSFGRTLAQLARIDVLILDDWGMTPLDQAARHDLLEVIDDRTRKSTVITSQLPIEHWHAWLNDPTVADAILDRLVHRSHRIPLKGESMRRKPPATPRSDNPS
jgi:DNA replication protein DnaC